MVSPSQLQGLGERSSTVSSLRIYLTQVFMVCMNTNHRAYSLYEPRGRQPSWLVVPENPQCHPVACQNIQTRQCQTLTVLSNYSMPIYSLRMCSTATRSAHRHWIKQLGSWHKPQVLHVMSLWFPWTLKFSLASTWTLDGNSRGPREPPALYFYHFMVRANLQTQLAVRANLKYSLVSVFVHYEH